VLDGQVGKNLIMMFDRIAALGHHRGHEGLRFALVSGRPPWVGATG
jgi:hypothetical protein